MMICNNCHKELNEKVAPFGYCSCKNKHLQCIKCDREMHKCCATCNSPTEIEMPDFKSLAKGLQKSCETKGESEMPQTSTQKFAFPDEPIGAAEDQFFNEVEVETSSNLSPGKDFFDPEQVINNVFDIKLDEHSENDLNPQPRVSAPSSSSSSLLSLNLFNLFEGDDASNPAPYAGSVYSSTSPSPPTIRSSHSRASDSSEESDHTLTKNDNDDMISVENFRAISPLYSPNSVNPPSSPLNICPFSPPMSDPEPEKEKEEEPKPVCQTIDVEMQKFLENFHESTSKPDWSKMDSRMPHIVRVLKRSYCPPEELPWRWLQTVSRVLKHDSEEAEKNDNKKEEKK